MLAAGAASAQTSAVPGTTNDDRVASELRALEKKWSEAEMAGDVDTVASILDDSFVTTLPNGQMKTKNDMLDLLRRREITVEPGSASMDELKVAVYGDAAVVRGRFRVKGMQEGRPLVNEGRFTDLFVRKNGRWVCVGGHGSAIAKQD
ncbi:MAG: nuclear transport factor 2 family protein [Acidimicrobiia bacterium]